MATGCATFARYWRRAGPLRACCRTCACAASIACFSAASAASIACFSAASAPALCGGLGIGKCVADFRQRGDQPALPRSPGRWTAPAPECTGALQERLTNAAKVSLTIFRRIELLHRWRRYRAAIPAPVARWWWRLPASAAAGVEPSCRRGVLGARVLRLYQSPNASRVAGDTRPISVSTLLRLFMLGVVVPALRCCKNLA